MQEMIAVSCTLFFVTNCDKVTGRKCSSHAALKPRASAWGIRARVSGSGISPQADSSPAPAAGNPRQTDVTFTHRGTTVSGLRTLPIRPAKSLNKYLVFALASVMRLTTIVAFKT